MKPGYKETEIGVLPDNWNTTVFSKCFTILKNNTLSRSELSYDIKGISNIHYGDVLIKYGNTLDCSLVALPVIKDSKKVADTPILNNGDLIIADTAEDESVGKATEIINTGNKTIVSGLHTIPCRPINGSAFYTGWLGYYINSKLYHDQLIPLITGIKVSSISKSSLSNTIVVIPPLAEQQRIAEALSDVDNMISSLEKLIEKKKAIKQGMMEQLLTGKVRLPGFEEEWEEVVIGEKGQLIKETINPQSFPSAFFWEYSMPAFDANIQPEKKRGNAMHSNRTKIYGRVLLFNKLNVRQKRIWYIENCPNNALCSSEFLAYCSEGIDLKLLKQILGTDRVTSDFIDMSTGTSNSQKRITPNDFLRYTVKMPKGVEQQKAISTILDDMDQEIQFVQEQIEKYQVAKQAMMQKLLSGKVQI